MNCDTVLLRFCFFFQNTFWLLKYFCSPFDSLPLTIASPSLHLPASPLWPCPAIAPLLYGLSFVTPAVYSFVPPSSAPFWSGTGISSLSLLLALPHWGFFFSPLTFMLEVCLACWLSAFTLLPESHHPAPISPSSAVFPQRPPVTVCDEQWLFILKLHECVPFLHASAPVGVCDFTESSVCQMCEFACLTIKVKDGRVRSRNGYR